MADRNDVLDRIIDNMNKRIAHHQSQVDELSATVAFLIKQKGCDDIGTLSSMRNCDSKKKVKRTFESSHFPEVAEFDATMKRLVTYLEGRISNLEGSHHKIKEGEELKRT